MLKIVMRSSSITTMFGGMEETDRRLHEFDPKSSSAERRSIARRMHQLLESGHLHDDLDETQPSIAYLIDRLTVYDGELSDPSLTVRWNYWVEGMEHLHGNSYERFEAASD